MDDYKKREQQQFLTHIAQDEDDECRRLVYADWLEENGQDDEALRQRKYKKAKQWLLDFCMENDEADPRNKHATYEEGGIVHNYKDEKWPIPYKKLLELASEAIEDGEYSIMCSNNEDMCQALRNNRKKFWENVSIVLGVSLPEGAEDLGYFSCSC